MNLGTPDEPTPSAVRRYLREFLSDPRVIDIAAPLRWLLLNAVILPTRPRRSAEAYEKVWSDDEGSPLMRFSKAQADALQAAMPGTRVVLAMRYGSPSLKDALAALKRDAIDDITVVPLYPQYASASTGSTIERAFKLTEKQAAPPYLRVVPEFYDDAGFITAFAAIASPLFAEFKPDFVLFSYHGLPERQVRACDDSGLHCLASATCCDHIVAENRRCYRAQCFATTRALCARLGLQNTMTSFQSRLGRTKWIEPYTDIVLTELAGRGIKRLAVFCPSFVADCLETLEEIQLRGKDAFKQAGGEDLLLVPSLNAHPRWIEALVHMIRRAPSE